MRLPSGGSIVVDQTEALTAVDVNSSRATKGSDIEDTAFQTNLEAAEEVARQLRLRDLGGLVVIDFIDMASNKHQREVENRLANALKYDRARVQVGRISRFGLLEMSRQRLRPSLGESSQIVCPRCDGHGRMRSVESLSLSIIRVAEEHAMKENTGQVLVQAPVEIAHLPAERKAQRPARDRQRHEAPIVIVADEQLHTPHYTVTRLRENELGEESNKPSYQRGTPAQAAGARPDQGPAEHPARRRWTQVKHTSPAPVREEVEPAAAGGPPAPVVAAPVAAAPSGGVIGWLKRVFGGEPAPAPAPAAPVARQQQDGGRKDRNKDRNKDRKERRDDSRGNGGNGNAQQQKDGGNRKDRGEQRKDGRNGNNGNAQQQPQQGKQKEPQQKDGQQPQQQNKPRNEQQGQNQNQQQPKLKQPKQPRQQQDGDKPAEKPQRSAAEAPAEAVTAAAAVAATAVAANVVTAQEATAPVAPVAPDGCRFAGGRRTGRHHCQRRQRGRGECRDR
ncbi:ribonuclease E/G [Stenotrophomonas sp. NRRL B-14846]|uniref:ribonuclease E/G n=1 Tax=Stenotrophomonas sp. NRRL B-14846 TaxID=3162882 RepID=UPI003D2D84B6